MMRPFLRRSGQLVRLSQRNLDASLRAATARRPPSFQPQAYAPLTQRRHASIPPEDPKQPEEAQHGKQPNDKSEGGRKRVGRKPSSSEDSQATPDASAKSQRTDPEDGQAQKSSETPKQESSTLPGHLPLTKAEEEMLDDFVRVGRERLSDSMTADVERLAAMVRKNGITPEAREVLEHYSSGKLDVMTTFKLIRHAIKILNNAATEAAEEEMKDKYGQTYKDYKDQPNNTNQQRRTDRRSQAESKQQSGGQGAPNGFNFKMDTSTMITSALLTWLTWSLIMPGENSKEITWQEFRNTFLEKGLVEKIIILNRTQAKVFLHREAVASQYPESPAIHSNFHYYFSIGSIEAFERKLDVAQAEMDIPSHDRIPVAYQEDIPWLATILSFGPTLLFIGVLVMLSRKAGGGGGSSGIFGMGRSRAKRFNHEADIKVKFADVAGMDEAKLEIMEFVSFLKDPGIYQKLGAKIPRGAILSGAPGTGKTLIAKATAGESGVPFFSVSGSEFVEMFVGVGPSRVRDLFATARKNTPCIIFIDEIDAIGRARSSKNFGGGGNDERESTLNQILTEMDGFNTSEQVVVIAGTNRPDVLDKALLRPGRFDRHITIDKPTMDGRKQIFAVHLKKIVTKEDLENLKGRLSSLTPGFSGADIANCVNEAALIAARNKASSVELIHFEQAIERVIGGLERKSLVLSPEEKRTVAYHEAGHAICGWYFKYADPLLKVSIIPRGQGALGYAQYLPSNGDTYLLNAHQLMDRMAMILGGRVSEELHFDTVTSGASDDFKKVTQMATAMVTRFGMSRKIGYLSFDDDQQQFHKPFSEETAKSIDAEVRRIVEDAYKQCRNLLTEKKHQVGLIAEELLKKEMLTRDDIIRILGPRPFEDKGEFHKYFGGGNPNSPIPEPPSLPDPPADGPPTGGPSPSPAFEKNKL